MGRTAYTEPQCLYKGDLYLYLFFTYSFGNRSAFCTASYFRQFKQILLEIDQTCFVYILSLMCLKKNSEHDRLSVVGFVRR